MLKLFQSIFGGGEQPGRYPESLVEMAIERAVDGTDPRIRALSGYRRHLRAPVIHAMDHAVALVDNLPAPLSAGRSDYSNAARLRALFASADHMLEVFRSDAVLDEFRARTRNASRATVLLLAEHVEKNVFGMDLSGDVLRRDVAQVSVSFHGYRLVDPAEGEEEARLMLKRRAFDHLLSLALARIVDIKREDMEFKRQRAVLKEKLVALQKAGWAFDETEATVADISSIERELARIQGQISALGMDEDALRLHLNVIAEILADAERQFWSEVIEWHLDHMNIRREAHDPSAESVRLQELHDARGGRVAILLLSLALDDLPPREEFSTAVDRYLC
jgi:hypothetical protein